MTDKVPIILCLSTSSTFDVKWSKTVDGITSDVETEGVTQFTTFEAKIAVEDESMTLVSISDDLTAPWWILWFVKRRSYEVKTAMFEYLPTSPLPSK